MELGVSKEQWSDENNDQLKILRRWSIWTCSDYFAEAVISKV